MSEKELAKQIIDRLPAYKITSLLLFLRGIEFSDEIEDDLYYEKLVEDDLDDDVSKKAFKETVVHRGSYEKNIYKDKGKITVVLI